jgi:hypothetical protein
VQEFAHDRHNFVLVDSAMNPGNVRKTCGCNPTNERIVMTSKRKALSLSPRPVVFEHRDADKSSTNYVAIIARE